ncbi:MAG: hypothetical protein RL839_01795 [Gammaproteobacteria bacterium]
MIKRLICCSLLAATLSFAAMAQQASLSSVQRELTIFAGILEESLRLNESTGLFGMSLGGVESIYLQGQGALFEIRSPLANRRNRMGLASLSSAMQALQLRQNPFQAMSLSSEPDSTTAAESGAGAEAGSTAYRQLLDRIAAIDYSAAAQNAMQQATQSARALQALGNVDDSDMAQINAEIAELRQGLAASLDRLRDLEQDIRAQLNESATPASDSDLGSRLDAVLQSLEPIKDQAVSKAEELRQRAAEAERDYAQAWQRDLTLFRDSLYQTLCEYGTTLEDLPDNESVTVILKGLGEDSEDNRRTDQIHIVAKARILACARGELDAEGLQAQSTSYTY